MSAVAPHEVEALHSLASGPVDLGSIDAWDKAAAALTYLELERRGYVERTDGEAGPIWMLAPLGVAYLRRRADG